MDGSVSKLCHLLHCDSSTALQCRSPAVQVQVHIPSPFSIVHKTV
jgi:hypothetical protein